MTYSGAGILQPRDRSITGFLGILTFVLIIVGYLIAPLWDAPGSSASAGTVHDYIGLHAKPLLISGFFYSLGVAAFMGFSAGVRDFLRSALFGYSSAVASAMMLIGFVPIELVAFRALDAATASLCYDLSFGILNASGIPVAISLGVYAFHIFRSRALPAWTAWLACVGALAHVLVSASLLSPEGFFSLEGQVISVVPLTFFVWALGTGIALYSGAGIKTAL